MPKRPTLPALASALALAGCAGSVGRSEAPSHPAPMHGASTGTATPQPSGALRDRVEAVAQAFRDRGGHPVANRWTTFLPPDGVRTMHVLAERERCLGFVAVGRESLGDIDIDLRNASAVRIAQDNRSNAHPYVRACVRPGDELFVVLRAVHGAGEAAVLTIADAPIVPPDLDSVLGVRATGNFTAPRTPRIAIGADPAVVDANHALDRVVQRLTTIGYRRLGAPLSGHLDTAHEDGREIELVAGECYAFLAVGGSTVDELDLRLISPEHRVLAQESATDSHPSLRTCPTTSGTHEVQIRMMSGAGEWALAVLQMDPAVEMPADVIGQERANTLEIAADGRRHGMQLLFGPVRGAVIANVPLSFGVNVRQGHCYLFGAAANEALAGLDLSLVDDHGAVVASDTATREVGRIYHCAPRTMRERVEVRGGAARGEFAFVVLGAAEATP